MDSPETRMRIDPEHLRRRLDPATLRFRSTAEVEPLTGIIGQPRATEALEFGLAVSEAGYNLFVTGSAGSGRETTVRDRLEQIAAERAAASDWVYVENFADPDWPNALELLPGQGPRLAADLLEFVTAAQRQILLAFESEDYASRRRQALTGIGKRHDALSEELRRFAAERGFAIEASMTGIVSMPLIDGRPISGEEFATLPEQQRQAVERRGAEVQERTAAVVRQFHELEKEATDLVRRLDRDVAQFATGALMRDLRDRYAEQKAVVRHLEQVHDDMLAHLDRFRAARAVQDLPPPLAQLQSAMRDSPADRYRVNVLVTSAGRGAPIVVERNPTHYNLVGRIDYRTAFGTMVTDVHQIKAGSLHRANGGFLVLHAVEVLRNPFAWDALKGALINRQIRIENLAAQLSPFPTSTLRPAPIPLDVKVVLIGTPELHHLLCQLDDDFRELFKVKVDFAPEMPWTDETVQGYAAFISRRVRESQLRHFDAEAVCRVIEHGARLRDHQGKLSTRLLEIADVVSEAGFWASQNGDTLVRAADVDRAIDRRRYRSNLVEERVRELISDGTIVIDTEGERIGQVNGVAVLDLGDLTFGRPSRVTARAALGAGGVKSIEREIELSGPIHSKGVLTLAGYLAGTYAQDWPLALGATITFEQSYDEIEGDSASSTELYALLSALAGLPLRQGIAVTGSINQHGEIQAVGGVTTKIEGFFAVCRERGLTGRQGMIIPAANTAHLMLEDEVVQAVRDGLFQVWAVRTADEGIELLTGRPAGVR
ncbi:MAG: Lon protease family protein, partial [Gaiellales bacterium]